MLGRVSSELLRTDGLTFQWTRSLLDVDVDEWRVERRASRVDVLVELTGEHLATANHAVHSHTAFLEHELWHQKVLDVLCKELF